MKYLKQFLRFCSDMAEDMFGQRAIDLKNKNRKNNEKTNL